ncbi:kinase-like domain-containing protein [Leucosporidium creatinivorum]|uniref:Kinase-like domain-containing protein n=1 Tax=Leucosporidium creatinivorum TaxID=106004 RepID=A0A1Y2DAP9_9BASI|nr:kinase-like domain-containing protein [Leucosporidium creatinivorum]
MEYSLQEKLGEGTFGLVGQGLKVRRGDVVALKQIILHNEGDGMPITSLREIRILKSLDHPNIVPVVDIAYEPGNAETFAPGKTYMVFPYMDHDLAGLLENHQVRLVPAQIKQYAMQLLEGTRYLHLNGILHRDMKAANLLISNSGVLMIADFGLARSIEAYEKRREYTNCVVTRWYRPPELLIGEVKYHFPVDMWGVGCVIAEMFKKTPIFPGDSDVNQAHKIFQHCGSPRTHTWPGWRDIPGASNTNWGDQPRTIRADALSFVSSFSFSRSFELALTFSPTCAARWSEQDHLFADLLDKILVLDPQRRLTASQALDHDWFWTDPMPMEPSMMPAYMASHEYDKRKREEERPRIPQIPQPQPPTIPPYPQPNFNQAPAYGQFPPFGMGAPPAMGYGAIPPPPGMPMGYGQQQQPPYGPPGRGGYGGRGRGGGGRGGGGGPYGGDRGGGGRPFNHGRYEPQVPSFMQGRQNAGGPGSNEKVNIAAMMAGAKPGAPSRH